MAAFNYWRVFYFFFGWLKNGVSFGWCAKFLAESLMKCKETPICKNEEEIADAMHKEIWPFIRHSQMGNTANTRQKICCPLI
jgi:hypothetical protein